MSALLAGALAVTGILQIRMVEGNGAVHTPSSRAARPLTVQITTDTGQPVPGATVTFQMPESGPGGVFASGLRTEVLTTDAQGRASVRRMRFNRVTGPFEIRILAVKDDVRAGTIARQFISDAGKAAARRPRARWLFLTAVGAGVAAGVLAGGRGETAPTPHTPALSIGTPSVAVTRP